VHCHHRALPFTLHSIVILYFHIFQYFNFNISTYYQIKGITPWHFKLEVGGKPVAAFLQPNACTYVLMHKQMDNENTQKHNKQTHRSINNSSYFVTQQLPLYGHYTGQPTLAGTSS